MTPTEYIVNAIRYTKAQNIAKGKLDKNGNPYKGLHVVIGKLNDCLRAKYATAGMTAEAVKQLPMSLVAKAEAEGKIVAVAGKMGPTVYLPEDAPARGASIKTAEEADKFFGMTPPPVIAPRTTRASE